MRIGCVLGAYWVLMLTIRCYGQSKVHQEARSARFNKQTTNPLKLSKKPLPKSKSILTLMLQLRQLCCHPGLGTNSAADVPSGDDPEEDGGDDLASVFGQLSVTSDPGAAVTSSKIELAMGLLRPLVKEEAPEGGCNKIVIISQWTGFLDLVQTPPVDPPPPLHTRTQLSPFSSRRGRRVFVL